MVQSYSGTNPFAPMKRASFETTEDTAVEQRPEYVEPDVTDEQTPSEEQVPDGTAKEVLEWVGSDKDRAQSALDAESAKGDDARKGLTRDLNDKLEN